MKFIRMKITSGRLIAVMVSISLAAAWFPAAALIDQLNRREDALKILAAAGLDGHRGEFAEYSMLEGKCEHSLRWEVDVTYPEGWDNFHIPHPLIALGWSAAATYGMEQVSSAGDYRVRDLGDRPLLDGRIVAAMACFPEIHTFQAESTRLAPDFLPALVARMKIVNLSLQRCDLTDDDCRILAGIETLETLWISDNPRIGDAGLAHLRTLPRLKGLAADGTGITDACCARLAFPPHLERLDIERTAVSERGLSALTLMPSLRRIGCRRACLGDDGATLLALQSLGMATADGYCNLDPSGNRRVNYRSHERSEPYLGEPLVGEANFAVPGFRDPPDTNPWYDDPSEGETLTFGPYIPFWCEADSGESSWRRYFLGPDRGDIRWETDEEFAIPASEFERLEIPDNADFMEEVQPGSAQEPAR